MEKIETIDQFSVDRDGRPSKVTDYKLFFPEDFEPISKPELVFTTNEDYLQPTFRINAGQIISDLDLLRKRRIEKSTEEHALVEVYDSAGFYRTKEILTGKTGIGFQLVTPLSISDYLHTHSINEGEDPMKVDLFSAFDLMSLGAKGAERYWLVGQDTAWCLVNLYGQKHYHYVKDAAWELANKESSGLPYDLAFSNLIDCVNKCSFRLYRGDNLRDFSLVS